MTTFIDFRYSASQAAALRQDYIEIEEELRLSAHKDCHLVLEISGLVQPGYLLRIGDMELGIDSDGILSLRYGEKYLTSTARQKVQTGDMVAVRFGPTHIGMRWQDVVAEHEVHQSPFKGTSSEVVLATGAKIMGRDTDRALKWGRLFYCRKAPQGLCIEVVMDWQNPQAGIPSSAIAIVEELVEQSDYKIKLTSYACDEELARKSDFSRLFGTQESPHVTLHIAPPIYSRANPSTINIGLFVVESTEVAASTISRCNEMDAVIVPTHFVAGALRKSGVIRPITVVPYGVDLEFFRPVEVKTTLKSGKSLNILSIAAYSERKNIYHLARAFMEEFRLTEDIALHLYIRPEYLTTQNNIVQEFTEWENWHFNESGLILMSTSYVSRTQLRDLYANADVYLMPSNEGFGFTLLEAMACGTPVIGLGYGGQTDFIDASTGYIVKPGHRYVCENMDLLPYVGESFVAPHRRHLRNILRHIFNNQGELVKRGRAAREKVEAQFSWPVVGKAFIDALGSIIATAEPRNRESEGTVRGQQLLTWMVGVIDDESITPALSSLTNERRRGSEVICLFTRFGKVREAQMARRRGFLLYRWDTTLENAKMLAAQLVKSEWAGLLYSDEKLSEQNEQLATFLAEQPDEVTEVHIRGRNGGYEPRLFRPRTKTGPGRSVAFDGLSLR